MTKFGGEIGWTKIKNDLRKQIEKKKKEEKILLLTLVIDVIVLCDIYKELQKIELCMVKYITSY